jgi:predicted metal-binding protein
MAGRVTVCTGCEGGEALAAALSEHISVSRTDCMNVCSNPACVSVREDGKAAYLFGGVSADLASDVAMFAALYDAAEGGIVSDARPIGDLRFRLIGRIPA